MRRRLAAPLLLGVALLAGCVVVPAHRASDHVAGYAGAPAVIVDTPPPPPYAEALSVMPFPGAVWVGGYWGWRSGRHHWVPGYWDRPHPGYYHQPHRWENRGGRWHLRLGGWIRL